MFVECLVLTSRLGKQPRVILRPSKDSAALEDLAVGRDPHLTHCLGFPRSRSRQGVWIQVTHLGVIIGHMGREVEWEGAESGK